MHSVRCQFVDAIWWQYTIMFTISINHTNTRAYGSGEHARNQQTKHMRASMRVRRSGMCSGDSWLIQLKVGASIQRVVVPLTRRTQNGSRSELSIDFLRRWVWCCWRELVWTMCVSALSIIVLATSKHEPRHTLTPKLTLSDSHNCAKRNAMRPSQ